MKKIFYIIIFLLFCITLSSCEELNFNDSIKERKYKVTIIDEDDFIYDKPSKSQCYYAAGDVIKLHSVVIYDADLAMFVNDEFYSIQNAIETSSGYIWEYEYQVKEEDVKIEFKIAEIKIDYINYYTLIFHNMFKGIELYAYKDTNNEYNFVMMPGTNAVKNIEDVQYLIDNHSIDKETLLDILTYATPEVKESIFLYLISNPVKIDELNHPYNEEIEKELSVLYIELGLR